MRIVILGGGLTGLSTAYHLEQQGFYNYKLFEKEAEVGGLCRSVHQDGFTFDYTGHLLHCSDAYFEQFLHEIGREHFNTIDRSSWIYSFDRYTKYPYQSNLHGLPVRTILECIIGFLRRSAYKKNPESFYAWAEQQFGSGINRNFFSSYQEKIFAYNIHKISASWTGRFVPQTSLWQLIYGALFNTQEKVGYNAQFMYPKKGGINFLVTCVVSRIINKINTNFSVQSIDLKNKQVLFSNGHSEKYDILISTIPLKTTLTIMNEPTTMSLKSCAYKLLCNSVVNFNIGIARDNVSSKHWVYYPEQKYPFYRIGFSSNFSKEMAPEGHSSLYGEFSYLKKDPQKIQIALKNSLQATKKLFGIQEHEIITEKIIDIPYAYVLYTPWRDRYLPKILKTLEENAVYSIGRYGAWKYSSMQEAMLDGKTMAQQLTRKI